MNDFLKEKERKNSGIPNSSKKWNRQTLQNYVAYLTEHFNVCLKEDSIPKTNARYTAENSLIGAMGQLIVVAMTHFYVADKEDVE